MRFLASNDCSKLNGAGDYESSNQNASSTSEKSFIQQRVERLYGPGALAQGFFRRSSSNKLNLSDLSNKSFNGSNNSFNKSLNESVNYEESLKNLPVLRHLRPEFRAQLPAVSPRRPADGPEQIVKSLNK